MTGPPLPHEAEYVAARKVLLDALMALAPHGRAIIVAGAQAVYLRTGSADLAVAPFTTDGDLALDPEFLLGDPRLETAMRDAGFHLSQSDGHDEPGVWLSRTTVDGRTFDIPVDLIVPAAVAPPGSRRSAHFPPHEKRAVRRAVGLEAALVDHDPMIITGLDPTDDRTVTTEIAGVAALLVAKAHKIHDRVAEPGRRRILDKDAGDIFRLMQTSDVVAIRQTLSELLAHPMAGDVTATGLRHLLDLFSRPASKGTLMAIDSFRSAVPADRVVSITNSFAASLSSLL